MTQLSNDTAARISARLSLNQCRCGAMLAAACPGEWEPGCDMGNNAAHVRVHRLTLVETKALDRALLRSVAFVDDVAPATPGLGETFWAMAQGQVDYSVEVQKINDLMTIFAQEGAIYITKEQACAFYGLVPAA